MFKQDLEKAEQLLDEVGWIDSDGDGIRDKEIDGKSVKFEFAILVAVSAPNSKKDLRATQILLRSNWCDLPCSAH